MWTGMFQTMKKSLIAMSVGLFSMMSAHVLAAETAAAQRPQTQTQQSPETIVPTVKSIEWKEFHSAVGRCRVSFPSAPEHVSQRLTTPEIGYDLKYDAYISSLDKKTVFMLLVAQYPDYVDQTYAQMSLEAFLNGILTYNPENQLIFADLLLVNGHEALDFFIRAGGVYFKGRAIMVKNSLYLMAMECDVKLYDEQNYNKFVDSFKLVVPEAKTK
jgi:hypothetical protein